MAAILALVGLLLLARGWRALRGLLRGDWVRAPRTRLLVTPRPGSNAPALTLERDGVALFGPVPLRWGEAPGKAGAAAGDAGPASGVYRVAAACRLDAPEEALARQCFGASVLLLQREGDGAPLLLHALARSRGEAPGALGLAPAALLELLGDPRGLRLELLRRDIRRAGWGLTRRRRGPPRGPPHGPPHGKAAQG